MELNLIKFTKLHIPVLLDESIDSLHLKDDGIYIVCTFGRGGHTFKIASMISSKGKIIAFDRDKEAIDFSTKIINSKIVQ